MNTANTTYFASNNTCYFPSEIFLDILTTNAGSVNKPQQYILAARLSTKYEYVAANKNGSTNIPIRLITSFIPITQEEFTLTKSSTTSSLVTS